MIKIIKTNKKIITLLVFILLIISTVLVSYSYYTNSSRYFLETEKTDGYSGYGLTRNALDFKIDGCGSGTILDIVTGLCWQKDMFNTGLKTWSNGVTYCGTTLDGLGGHIDWRLPTQMELVSIGDQIGLACTTLQSFGFVNCQNNYYWSATTHPTSTTYALIYNFNDGGAYNNLKTTNYYVMCVRRN